jgi:hypothetical protein
LRFIVLFSITYPRLVISWQLAASAALGAFLDSITAASPIDHH